MKRLEIKQYENGNELVVEFSGTLDDNCILPTLTTKKKVRLRLGGVSLMNSYGVKLWCRWVIQHSHLSLILLDECPYILVRNFGSIRGLLGLNMKVLSFFVPFYSQQTQETKYVLLHSGEDYFDNGVWCVPQVFDSQGLEMEIDVDSQSYFEFLKPKTAG